MSSHKTSSDNKPVLLDLFLLVTLLRPETPVVLVCRVSQRHQRRNLKRQERELRKLARSLELIVVGVFHHIGSGNDPLWLKEAAEYAKQHEAILLGESVDRFIRHPDHFSNPRPADLNLLSEMVGDVPLAVANEPESARSAQVQRSRPGHPFLTKRSRREKLLDTALLMRTEGTSIRQIADTLGVPKSTIADWLKRSVRFAKRRK